MKKLFQKLCSSFAVLFLVLPSLIAMTPKLASASPTFAGGDGSEATPFLISTCTQLQSIDDIGNTDDLYFKLASDVDCSDTYNWNDDGEGGYYGFLPIGYTEGRFSGDFDGDGHAITDLYINRRFESGVGLFKSFSTSTTRVYDLTIADASVNSDENVGILVGESTDADISHITVSGNVIGDSYNIGGVAGAFYGGTADYVVSNANVTGDYNNVGGFSGSSGCGAVISNSYATGTIESEGEYIGGFSGQDGCEGPGSTMTRVWASGDVTSSEESYVGGLVGNATNATFIETYATGAVTAPEGITLGGLIGQMSNTTVIRSFSSSLTNKTISGVTGYSIAGLVGDSRGDSSITDSYARRNVIGNDTVGGLAGFAEDLVITHSYAAGALSSDETPPNGVIGYSNDATSENSFWDTEVTGTETDPEAIGLSTVLMKTPATFTDAGWSTSVWTLNNGQYPCLRWSEVSCADNDGVDIETEAAAPNSGDGNNDGTPDSQQPNITSVLSPTSGKYVSLESTCTSNYNVQIGGQAAGSSDGNYIYPAGLIGFVLQGCTIGGTATITQYYYGTYDLSKLSLRKWQDNTYKNVPGAVFTNVIIGGQPAVKAVYQITDGSSLDDDGIADGNIVDPAGIATTVLGAATVGAPNTGLPRTGSLGSILMVTTSLGILVTAGNYVRKTKTTSKR